MISRTSPKNNYEYNTSVLFSTSAKPWSHCNILPLFWGKKSSTRTCTACQSPRGATTRQRRSNPRSPSSHLGVPGPQGPTCPTGPTGPICAELFTDFSRIGGLYNWIPSRVHIQHPQKHIVGTIEGMFNIRAMGLDFLDSPNGWVAKGGKKSENRLEPSLHSESHKPKMKSSPQFNWLQRGSAV